MQKKDLKSKMVVKLRNEDFYLVVDDVLVREEGFILLSKYYESMIHNGNNEFDIVEVFKIINSYYSFTNDLGMSSLNFSNIGENNNLKSLWKRTLSYDCEELIEGEKVYLVNKIGNMSVIYNIYHNDFYHEDYKYFVSEENALKYIEICKSPLFSLKDFVKNRNNNFEEHCENIIKEKFLKAIEKL